MTQQHRDEEWARWKADFEREGATRPAGGGRPALGPQELEARVRRETKKAYLGAAHEILASLAVIGFYGVLIVRGEPGVILPMASATFVYLFVYLGYLFHVRRETWRAPGRTSADFLALTLRRRRADARLFGFSRAALAVFAIVVAAWAPFVLAAKQHVYAAEPWRAVVGFGVAYAILIGMWVYHGRRRARALREVRELEAMREALTNAG